MLSQNTFEQLLQLQRKLNEQKKASDEKGIPELEAEKRRLWQKLNEENVAVFNEIIFKPLHLYPFRPSPTSREFIDETLDLWREQPDWLLTVIENHYWEKDNQEGRLYKSQTCDAYLGIRNILIQNLAMSAGRDARVADQYISALKKPRSWLAKLERDLRSVGKRLEEIAPELKRRTVRVLLLPSGEQAFVSDEPGEDAKMLKEAQERFPNAAVIQAADVDILNSIKDREYPNGAIILTRFWISTESLYTMAIMVKYTTRI